MRSLEHYPSTWCQQVAGVLQTKSPLSLKVTLRQLQAGMKLTFDECMEMEYRLTQQFLQSPDFFEGVRAAIIDKDQKPLWKPAQLENVTAEQITAFFSSAFV
jgi:enoyl-CoA hydratase